MLAFLWCMNCLVQIGHCIFRGYLIISTKWIRQLRIFVYVPLATIQIHCCKIKYLHSLIKVITCDSRHLSSENERKKIWTWCTKIYILNSVLVVMQIQLQTATAYSVQQIATVLLENQHQSDVNISLVNSIIKFHVWIVNFAHMTCFF